MHYLRNIVVLGNTPPSTNYYSYTCVYPFLLYVTFIIRIIYDLVKVLLPFTSNTVEELFFIPFAAVSITVWPILLMHSVQIVSLA